MRYMCCEDLLNSTAILAGLKLPRPNFACGWSQSRIEVDAIVYIVATSLTLMFLIFLLALISAYRLSKKMNSGYDLECSTNCADMMSINFHQIHPSLTSNHTLENIEFSETNNEGPDEVDIENSSKEEQKAPEQHQNLNRSSRKPSVSWSSRSGSISSMSLASRMPSSMRFKIKTNCLASEVILRSDDLAAEQILSDFLQNKPATQAEKFEPTCHARKSSLNQLVNFMRLESDSNSGLKQNHRRTSSPLETFRSFHRKSNDLSEEVLKEGIPLKHFCKVHSRHFSLSGLTDVFPPPLELVNDDDTINVQTESKHLYAKKKTKRYCDTAPRRLYNVETGDDNNEFEVYKPHRRSAIQFDVFSMYSNL